MAVVAEVAVLQVFWGSVVFSNISVTVTLIHSPCVVVGGAAVVSSVIAVGMCSSSAGLCVVDSVVLCGETWLV